MTTTTNPIPEIRATHQLTTHRSTRNGTTTRTAGCFCGVRFDWTRRLFEHDEHVDAVIVEHFTARIADARREAETEVANAFVRWAGPAETAEPPLDWKQFWEIARRYLR